ncbi:MAG: hypothetical protein ACHP7P_14730 [Terriglobales bacterium]
MPADQTQDDALPLRAARDEQLERLRLEYERVCGERDRLRNARGFFARPLGPAPASAGISTALVTTLGSNLDRGYLALALISLLLLVVLGLWYDGKPAYRHLYAREIRGVRGTVGKRARATGQRSPNDSSPSLSEWYREMIAREIAIIGEEQLDNTWRWPWQPVRTLQEGLDSERTGLRSVQMLWLMVIGFLVLAVLA